MTIERLEALGEWIAPLKVNVADVYAARDVHGLLGLNFLDELNYEIRARDGVIIAERADTGS